MTQLAIVFEDKNKDRYEALTLKGLAISLENMIDKLKLERNGLNKTFELIYIEKTGEKRRLANQQDFQEMMRSYKRPFCHVFCEPKAYRVGGGQTEVNEIIERQNRRIYMLEQELDDTKLKNRNLKDYILELEQRTQHLKFLLEKSKRSHNNLYVCDPPEMDKAMNFVMKVKEKFIERPWMFNDFVRMAQKQDIESLNQLLGEYPELQHELGSYLKYSWKQRQQQQNKNSIKKPQFTTPSTEIYYSSANTNNYREGNPSEVYHPQKIQTNEEIHKKLINMGFKDQSLNEHLIGTFNGNLEAILKVLRAYTNFVE